MVAPPRRSPASTRYEQQQVLALTGGRLGYAVLVGEALRQARRHGLADPGRRAHRTDAAAAAPLERRLRLSYEVRLQRARGYGALRAILDVLAEQQPLTLTQIAQRLHRTPGSTKDYLSWMLDVDLLPWSASGTPSPIRCCGCGFGSTTAPTRRPTRRWRARRSATPATASRRSPDAPVSVARGRPSSAGGIIEID